MCLSAVLVTIGVQVFKRLSEIIIKIVVDIGLFILSFWIQREWIFKEKST